MPGAVYTTILGLLSLSGLGNRIVRVRTNVSSITDLYF
jgi:hypothetical protein